MIKNLVVILSVIVMAASAAIASPVGTVIEAQCNPAQRIILPNGVVKAVVSITLDKGKWVVQGGATVQVNVDPQTDGQYIYVVGAFSKNPNTMPLDGTAGLDARPYGTGWIPANPKPHAIRINNNSETVYLVVLYFGQTPAELVETFGNITALRVPGN